MGLTVQPDLTREITELMDQLEAPLLRYCTRLLRRPDLAQDIVQESFIRFLNHRRETPDTAINNPKSWLHRVAHNFALDHIRRNRRGEAIQEELGETMRDASHDGPGDRLDRRDAAAAAWQMLDLLSERDRQVVTMKIVDKRSYKEIAEAMDLTVTNVGFILHNSLKKMARELAPKLA